jgi:hypothetical protein
MHGWRMYIQYYIYRYIYNIVYARIFIWEKMGEFLLRQWHLFVLSIKRYCFFSVQLFRFSYLSRYLFLFFFLFFLLPCVGFVFPYCPNGSIDPPCRYIARYSDQNPPGIRFGIVAWADPFRHNAHTHTHIPPLSLSLSLSLSLLLFGVIPLIIQATLFISLLRLFHYGWWKSTRFVSQRHRYHSHSFIFFSKGKIEWRLLISPQTFFFCSTQWRPVRFLDKSVCVSHFWFVARVLFFGNSFLFLADGGNILW